MRALLARSVACCLPPPGYIASLCYPNKINAPITSPEQSSSFQASNRPLQHLSLSLFLAFSPCVFNLAKPPAISGRNLTPTFEAREMSPFEYGTIKTDIYINVSGQHENSPLPSPPLPPPAEYETAGDRGCFKTPP